MEQKSNWKLPPLFYRTIFFSNIGKEKKVCNFLGRWYSSNSVLTNMERKTKWKNIHDYFNVFSFFLNTEKEKKVCNFWVDDTRQMEQSTDKYGARV